jgi:hypothetical protein
MRYVFSYYNPRSGRTYETEPMSVEEAVNYFSYTLLAGASYEHEKGNKKINQNPKNIKSLIDNLNKASKNASKGGLHKVYRAHNVL